MLIETAAMVVTNDQPPAATPTEPVSRVTISGLTGTHGRISESKLELDYHEFTARLQRYESLRRPRTARVVRESAEMGELYHIGDAQTMREAFAQRNIAASRNGWLYPYDPITAPLEPAGLNAA